MQLLAQFQIEPVDHPGDGGWRARTQRFGKRPQGLFALRGLDQDKARRVETETVETMTIRAAVFAPPIGRHDEDDWISVRQAGQKRDDEAEGGR